MAANTTEGLARAIAVQRADLKRKIEVLLSQSGRPRERAKELLDEFDLSVSRFEARVATKERERRFAERFEKHQRKTAAGSRGSNARGSLDFEARLHQTDNLEAAGLSPEEAIAQTADFGFANLDAAAQQAIKKRRRSKWRVPRSGGRGRPLSDLDILIQDLARAIGKATGRRPGYSTAVTRSVGKAAGRTEGERFGPFIDLISDTLAFHGQRMSAETIRRAIQRSRR